MPIVMGSGNPKPPRRAGQATELHREAGSPDLPALDIECYSCGSAEDLYLGPAPDGDGQVTVCPKCEVKYEVDAAGLDRIEKKGNPAGWEARSMARELKYWRSIANTLKEMLHT